MPIKRPIKSSVKDKSSSTSTKTLSPKKSLTTTSKKVTPTPSVTVMKKSLGEEFPVKEGTPLDESKKATKTTKMCGMSKGVTKNMGNYESARVDVWLSDDPLDHENVEDCFQRISDTIDQVLITTCEQLGIPITED